jgi:hypothetical protein
LLRANRLAPQGQAVAAIHGQARKPGARYVAGVPGYGRRLPPFLKDALPPD